MSPTLKPTEGGPLWAKIWGGSFDRCKPNFNAIIMGETWGKKKSCRYLLPFEHNART